MMQTQTRERDTETRVTSQLKASEPELVPRCKLCSEPVAVLYVKKGIPNYFCTNCTFLQNYYWEERNNSEDEKITVNDRGRQAFWPAGEREHMRQKGWELIELMTSPIAWRSRKVHQIIKFVPGYDTWTKQNAKKKLAKVLDFGCGHGVSVIELRKDGLDIVGLDPYSPTEDASIYQTHLHEQQFNDEAFDGIFTVETMEHIPNVVEVFQELHRILKPGGVLLVQTRRLEDPDYAAQKENWFYLKEPSMHVAIYSEAAMKKIAEIVGFSEVSFRGVKFAKFVK